MSSSNPVVMLVDDEPRILSALSRILRREGYEILTKENARSALDEMEIRKVDLVVSDHKMPGMSGIAMLCEIAGKWPSTARILLSGWSSEIDPARMAAARLTAVLTKPWEDDELKATIRSALSK